MQQKQCNTCEVEKAIEEFYFNKKQECYSPKCKECSLEYQRNYHILNKDYRSNYHKQYFNLNREEYLEKQRNRYQAKRLERQLPIPDGFQQIPNYPKHYINKDTHQVWSTVGNRFLKVSKGGNGYIGVGLTHGDRKGLVLLHRILAEMFIPNPNNLECINHKNGNKLDNSLENLEWVTHKENTRHAMETGLFKPGQQKYNPRNLSKEEVLEIRENPKKESRDQLAARFNVTKHSIYNVQKNRTWKNV